MDSSRMLYVRQQVLRSRLFESRKRAVYLGFSAKDKRLSDLELPDAAS